MGEGDYLKRISELTDLSNHKINDVKNLRIKLRNRDEQDLNAIETVFEEISEAEKHLSYVWINKRGRTIASTPTFRKILSYNDTDRPIKGRLFYTALKAPDDAPDYISNIRRIAENPKEVLEKQTTIYDGEGKEKIIKFQTYEPVTGRLGDKDFSYTRIDVYVIGWVERKFGDVMRRLHIIDGEPRTLEKFIAKRIIEKTRADADKEKEKILSGKSLEKEKAAQKAKKRKAAKIRLKERKKRKKQQSKR